MSGKKRSNAGILRRRASKALAVVVAGAVVCCGIDGALAASRHLDDMQEVFAATAPQPDSTHEGDENSTDSRGYEGRLLEGFQEEVVSLGSRSSVRVGAEGSVVGFVEQGLATEAFSALASDLQERSWRTVDSGRSDCGSFVKEEGSFTWLFVNCVQVGEETSVVIYCPVSAQNEESR